MPAQTTIQVRRGTAASWTSTNPTLAAGEVGLETDTGKYKIGDGSSTWSSLAYYPTLGANTFTGAQTATSFIVTGSSVPANGVYLPAANTLGFATDSTVRMRIDSTGNIGIGTTPGTSRITITGNATGGTAVSGINNSPTIQSDVTSQYRTFISNPSTAASAFTLGNLRHFMANQGTIGASSAITNQIGFYVEANLTGATNNYGFQGSLAAASGVWNFFSSGTAANYFAGQTTVGSTSLTLGSGSVAQQFGVVSTSATNVGMVIRGAASQTGDLLEIQNSAGTILAQVDSAGVVIAGSSAALTTNVVSGTSKVQITGNGAANSSLGLTRTDPSTPVISFNSGSSGNTVASGFAIMNVSAGGYDGTSYSLAGTIEMRVDGTVSTGVVPGRIAFLTANSSGVNTERMRIDSSGNVGIGVTPSAGRNLTVSKNLTGNASLCLGIASGGTTQSDVTGAIRYFSSSPQTAAASFTIGEVTSYFANNVTIGSTSAVTNQYGFVATALSGASNNYGFYSNSTAASGVWNFFANGTANNAFAGNSRFGGTSAPTVAVDVTGAIAATTSITSSGATSGIGYAAGAGGAATQGAGSGKSTAVTLNNVTGNITMNNATLNAATVVNFTLTNSAIAANDMVVVQHVGTGTLGAYTCTAVPAAGSATVYVRNNSASNLGEAIVLKFVVIKAVVA